MNARFQPRYFCSLDDLEATRVWFVIDSRTGVPVFADGQIRYFTRVELGAFLSQQEDGQVDRD